METHAKSQKLNLDGLVFHGGEEYEFVFTVNPKHKQAILKNANGEEVKLNEPTGMELPEGGFAVEDNGYQAPAAES